MIDEQEPITEYPAANNSMGHEMRYQFRNLSGELFTIIDAVLGGDPRAKHTKDLVRQAVWHKHNRLQDFLENLEEENALAWKE